MQYTTMLLSALAATTLAAPTRRQADRDVVVVGLSNIAAELGSGTRFVDTSRRTESRPTASRGPFTSVELQIGEGVANKALRCQILNEQNQPIVITRGANVDITFADGDAGEWQFRDGESVVNNIICDPSFVKGEAPPPAGEAPEAPEAPEDDDEEEDVSIRVTLTDGNLATQTAFEQEGEVREKKKPVGSSGPFNSVNLAIGADVEKQDLRCQLLDQHNKPITVQRGANIDTTFADGGAGPWKFLHPESAKVKKIVCDPKFVKASA